MMLSLTSWTLYFITAIADHKEVTIIFRWSNFDLAKCPYFLMTKTLSQSFTIVLKNLFLIIIHYSIKNWIIWISQMHNWTHFKTSNSEIHWLYVERIYRVFLNLTNFLEMVRNCWNAYTHCLHWKTSETNAVLSGRNWILHTMLCYGPQQFEKHYQKAWDMKPTFLYLCSRWELYNIWS